MGQTSSRCNCCCCTCICGNSSDGKYVDAWIQGLLIRTYDFGQGEYRHRIMKVSSCHFIDKLRENDVLDRIDNCSTWTTTAPALVQRLTDCQQQPKYSLTIERIEGNTWQLINVKMSSRRTVREDYYSKMDAPTKTIERIEGNTWQLINMEISSREDREKDGTTGKSATKHIDVEIQTIQGSEREPSIIAYAVGQPRYEEIRIKSSIGYFHVSRNDQLDLSYSPRGSRCKFTARYYRGLDPDPMGEEVDLFCLEAAVGHRKLVTVPDHFNPGSNSPQEMIVNHDTTTSEDLYDVDSGEVEYLSASPSLFYRGWMHDDKLIRSTLYPDCYISAASSWQDNRVMVECPYGSPRESRFKFDFIPQEHDESTLQKKPCRIL